MTKRENACLSHEFVVPIHLNAQDRKRAEKIAKANNQTVSEWMRTALIPIIWRLP
jgi:hypothetical protein